MERAGRLARRLIDLYKVVARSTVPKVTVIIRKAFGFGSSIMAMNPFDGQTITLAFPSITLGALPAYAEDPPHAREAPEDTAPVPPTSQDAAPPTAPATPPSDSAPPPPPAARREL